MKKIISLIMAAALCVSLAACGSSSSSTAASGSKAESASGSTAIVASLAKSIEAQVPASAGGGTDVVARAISSYINQNCGTNMTIVNNTDGSGVVAMETVRTGKSDGSEILIFHTSMCIKTATGVYNKSAAEDFKIIAVSESAEPGGYVLVVSANSNIKSLDDYIKAAQDKNGSLMLGVETGGSSHIMGGIMAQALGITLNYVEAGPDTDKLTALVGGSIDSALVNANQAKQYIEAGKITPLACFSATEEGGRCSNLPDVPSFKEQGYDCVYSTRFFVLANPAMDDATAEAIHYAFAAAVEDPATSGILTGAGMGMTILPYADGPAALKEQQDSLNTICSELGLKK